MLGTTVLEGMGEEELLTFAGTCAETVVDAEVGLLRVAYQWAVTHGPDRLDPDEARKPGREKARMYGGDGTPEVCEFAAAELGARIRKTTWAAAQLMGDALDVYHRHPLLAAAVEAGRVKVSYARHVVSKTRQLTQKQAGFVDRAIATAADGRIPWTRFEKLVDAKVAQADPKTAREKEVKARRAVFAKKLRAQAFGMGSFLIHAPIPVIDQIAAQHAGYSAAIKDDFPDLTVDERDVQAILMLLTPGADQDPTQLVEAAPVVNLYVHIYSGPESTGMARVDGHGVVTDDWVRDVLGPSCRFKVFPVIDLEGQAPVDAYEIPDRHRQAVHLMTPADTFPYGSSTERSMQVDHTVPHEQGGESGVGNYGPMTIPHHRIKTHGRWQVQQPFPGIYVWRDQHGAFYLVDHTGTRQIPNQGDNLPLVIEIYRHLPAAELDWDAA